jgi:hypothetical protein
MVKSAGAAKDNRQLHCSLRKLSTRRWATDLKSKEAVSVSWLLQEVEVESNKL